jgi:thiol:disulfide interchange protein DsbD
VRIFACKESCLPKTPFDIEATLTITGSDATNGAVTPRTASTTASTPLPPATAPEEPSLSSDYAAALDDILSRITRQQVEPNTGLGSFLLTAMFWGMVTLFTPCVFPMIPITVSFFLKQAEKNQGNALVLALVYCGTIVVVLGIAALTLLQFFTILSINPWMNVFLGALFVVLALSLFGMFDFTLQLGLRAAIVGVPILLVLVLKPAGPRWMWIAACVGVIILLLTWLNKWIERAAFQLQQSTAARSNVGGLIGTVFMAISFTIVSFTCVAPFLGGFGGMAASGQFRSWELILGAMAFSGTFAAPFFLLALFPALLKKLPKSGGWLNSVKVIMGFLELAAALKFFRTAELIHLPQPEVFTFDLVLGMWIALSLLCGLYLINMFRIGHDEPLDSVSVPRLLIGFLFLSMAFYLTPAMFAGSEGERQRPRGTIYAWVESFLLPESGNQPGKLPWVGDLKKSLDEAQAESQRSGRQKFVFVDFTGESCTNCKLNEESVFRKPEVQELFKSYKLAQLFTDKVPNKYYPSSIVKQFRGSTERQQADAELNRKFQQQAFGTIQLPLYVILKPTPEGPIEVVGTYSEGKINNEAAFVEFLRKPLEN